MTNHTHCSPLQADSLPSLPGLRFVALALTSLLCLFTPACKTTDKAPTNRMAAVQIDGRSQDIIYTAVREVFEKEGFAGVGTEAGELVFERKGGTLDDVVYGTWLDSDVWMRVKVRARPSSMDSHILECNAYMVMDKGEMFFEDEKKVPYTTRRKLQGLLGEVKKTLN